MFSILDIMKLGSWLAVLGGGWWALDTYQVIERDVLIQAREQNTLLQEQITTLKKSHIDLTSTNEILVANNRTLSIENQQLTQQALKLEEASRQQSRRIARLTDSLENSTTELLEVYQKLVDKDYARVERLSLGSDERASDIEQLIERGTRQVFDDLSEITQEVTGQDEQPE